MAGCRYDPNSVTVRRLSIKLRRIGRTSFLYLDTDCLGRFLSRLFLPKSWVLSILAYEIPRCGCVLCTRLQLCPESSNADPGVKLEMHKFHDPRPPLQILTQRLEDAIESLLSMKM